MWLVTVLLQGDAAPVSLQYRDAERAKAAYLNCVSPPDSDDWRPNLMATVSDDFGRKFTFVRNLLSRVLFADVALSIEGDRSLQLLNAISQAVLQAEILDHPVVRDLNSKMQKRGQVVMPQKIL